MDGTTGRLPSPTYDEINALRRTVGACVSSFERSEFYGETLVDVLKDAEQLLRSWAGAAHVPHMRFCEAADLIEQVHDSVSATPSAMTPEDNDKLVASVFILDELRDTVGAGGIDALPPGSTEGEN